MTTEIHIAGLSSWRGLKKLSDDSESAGVYYGPIQHWMEAKDVAWLVELLKVTNDDPEYFPCGKWALIQQLQDLVSKAATSEIITNSKDY